MFLWHIRKLNMIEKENNKYPPPTLINDIKNKKLKEKLINILNNIDEISNKKINDFEESVKKFKNVKNYKLTNFLQERHFMFKAIHEINEEITKNKEGFQMMKIFITHFKKLETNLPKLYIGV